MCSPCPSVAGLAVGGTLWLIALAFRVWPMTLAARGARPPGLELAATWIGGLFPVWGWLGNASVVMLGAVVVRADRPADRCGWAAAGLAGLVLVQLLATGDARPALYHVAPAPISVALLLE